MNSLAEKIESARYSKGVVIVRFASGLEVRFPIQANPRLARGTDEALSKIEVSPFGLHWPELDEDLSFAGLLQGDYGQRRATNLAQ